MALKDPIYPYFKVRPFFDVEYLHTSQYPHTQISRSDHSLTLIAADTVIVTMEGE